VEHVDTHAFVAPALRAAIILGMDVVCAASVSCCRPPPGSFFWQSARGGRKKVAIGCGAV